LEFAFDAAFVKIKKINACETLQYPGCLESGFDVSFQAIVESNFTYTGARMCDWFVRNFSPISDGKPIKFLGLLMKR
jgi:hypothetical protein